MQIFSPLEMMKLEQLPRLGLGPLRVGWLGLDVLSLVTPNLAADPVCCSMQ